MQKIEENEEKTKAIFTIHSLKIPIVNRLSFDQRTPKSDSQTYCHARISMDQGTITTLAYMPVIVTVYAKWMHSDSPNLTFTIHIKEQFIPNMLSKF